MMDASQEIKGLLALLLRAAIVLVGIAALIFLLGEPHFEGRNVHATLFEIYFNDPFLAYVYIGSMPFFIALYQAFALLGHLGRRESLRRIRTIKHCGVSLIAFTLGAAVLLITQRGEDDIAGGLAMVLCAMVISAGITVAAATAEKTVSSERS